MSWVQQVHNAAVVARSLGCQCDTEMPTKLEGSIHEHPIPTNPKNPEWYVKAYHQSPVKQKFLHEYAEELYKHGIIEDAEKRCCITPALAVTKPGAPAGLFRFAQDFRAGNKFTLTDRHGLPRPIDVAYELSGAAYITEIDLASGYWNIWITNRLSACYISRHVPGADISLYPVSSCLSKWIKPGAK